MEYNELICRLNNLKIETGSIACLGCGCEHNCSTKGCNIIREAIHKLEEFNDFSSSQVCKLLKRNYELEKLLAQTMKREDIEKLEEIDESI